MIKLMKALVLIMVAVWSSLPIIAFGFATSDQDLPAGIISVEPTEETCPEGYDITKDGQDCVRGGRVDCDPAWVEEVSVKLRKGRHTSSNPQEGSCDIIGVTY